MQILFSSSEEAPGATGLGILPGKVVRLTADVDPATRTLARLDTPEKIQAFVDAIPQNFEIGGITCLSVREVLRQRRALCIEGAFVAARR